MMYYSILIEFFCWISTVICFNDIDYNIHGTTATEWEFVRDLFKQNFAQGFDTSASITIYHNGLLVVDLTGGWFDELRTKPYDNDTLQLVYSTSKGLVAAAVALCVQQGLLDYSSLVTKYWPEYGQNGKENTTVADVMSHRAGVPEHPPSLEEHLNSTAMIQWLEKQSPIWSPGTAQGYHGVTFGWLAGELIRRVDPKKKTIGQFIQDEIANRIQTEFYIGLPSNQEHRVSPVVFTDVRGILNESTLDEDSTLESFRDRPIKALRVVSVTNSSSNNELLLVFRQLGIYVSSSTGIQTRHRELMLIALAISTAFNHPYLLIYTEKSVDIYDVPSATWLQSLPLSRTRSLTADDKGESLQIISGLKQVSPTNTLSSISYGGSGATLNNHNRRSLISDISTFASDLSTTNKAAILAPINFRHQVHIGHNDEIDQLNNNNNNKSGTHEQQQSNSVKQQQQQVTSSGNSTLPSQSFSFKDDDDSDQSLE
ncbi:unnamed protein product [Rotaria sordida]|uniref:CRIB domain-containing protein n=1 Tax=Rotaria sordida TaxID=392033 RepID=A0A819P4T0_9BILA|nr:unnamed protein product [Rotaria sordida]